MNIFFASPSNLCLGSFLFPAPDMATRDGKSGINITYNCFFCCFSIWLMSRVFPLPALEIPTSGGKFASTLLSICCVGWILFYCYYLEVVILASSVAARILDVKSTTDRKCFISVTWLSGGFCISVKFNNSISFTLYLLSHDLRMPNTSYRK